jgi:Tn3 transposase DDE domain
MTKALQGLIDEGHQIDEEALACLSPYQTEHINHQPVRAIHAEAG